ncbi:MAG: hypothetical protein ABGW84_10825 [Sphingomonadaceae bacterium]
MDGFDSLSKLGRKTLEGIKVSTFERLSREYFAQGFAFLVTLLDRLVVPAIFLRALGVDGFSLWAIAIAAAAYVSVADIGTTRYFTNRLITLLAAGRGEDGARAFAVGQTLVVLLAALSALAIMALYASGLLGSEFATRAELWPVVAALLGAAFITQAISIRRALYRAHAELERETWIGLTGLLLQIIGLCVSLILGASLQVAALVWMIGAFLFIFMPFMLDSRRRFPDFAGYPASPSPERMAEIAHIAPGLWLQALATTAFATIPVLAIGALSSVAALVAGFVLMRTLANFVRQVLHIFASVLALELARRDGERENGGYALFFFKSTRFLGVQTAAAAGALIVLGGPLFALWTGRPELFSQYLLWLAILPPLLAPHTITAIEAFAYANRPWPLVVARGLQALITATAFFLLPFLSLDMRFMSALMIGEVFGFGIVLAVLLPRLDSQISAGGLVRLYPYYLAAFAASWSIVALAMQLSPEDYRMQIAIGLPVSVAAFSLVTYFLAFDRAMRASTGQMIGSRLGSLFGRFGR